MLNRLKLAIVALVFAPTHVSAQEAGNRLNLVCGGGGSANQASSSYGQAWDDEGNSVSGVVTQQRAVGFEDQLQLWIEGSTGKARMPRAMLPVIRGGENGWFDIRDIKVTDNEITGTVTVNFMNRPKLVLDRLTGTVSLAGKAGQFSGRCQKFDPNTVKRAF